MVCRIHKPACAGNGCAIFLVFQTADWGQKIRCPASRTFDLNQSFLRHIPPKRIRKNVQNWWDDIAAKRYTRRNFI